MFLPSVHSSLSKDETLDLELTFRREIEIAKETFGAFIFYDDFKEFVAQNFIDENDEKKFLALKNKRKLSFVKLSIQEKYKTSPKTVEISSPKYKSQLNQL